MAKEYKSEDEFLKDYDISKFDQLSMTADILLISVSDHETSNYRKTNKKTLSILLVKRNEYPYKDTWCLPGGFLNPKNETLEECAMRVLKQETNLENIYLEQLYTFDDPKRDPRTRVVSTSYMALIDKNKLTQMINKNASWFDVVLLEDNEKEVTITLTNGVDTIHVNVKKTGRYTVTSLDNKDLAFDHDLVIVSGLERLRNKLSYTDIVFNMMPEYFTLGELQKVYEVILNKKLLDPAFRRIIANKVEKTDKMKTGEGHRPSALFKYKE